MNNNSKNLRLPDSKYFENLISWDKIAPEKFLCWSVADETHQYEVFFAGVF